ncbi:MAG: DUF3108 domain-containing protein [Pseudomonadales bacterium]
MQYWATKNYQPVVTSLTTSRTTCAAESKRFFSKRCLLLIIATLLLCSNSLFSFADSRLTPYHATYTTHFSGITADMEHSLKKLGNDQWLLRNYVSIMFMGFEEKARFVEHSGQLTPQTYQYRNKLSSKRNSTLTFNSDKSSVTDSTHSKTPLQLPAGALDKLSFQVQLRLDLMAQYLLDQQEPFAEKTYHLVDRTQYKTYNVKYLGEETIETPAGKFNTLKMERRRSGKDKHTLIWLAKDWDYFVLRIQRMKKGKSSYQVNLKHASINGKTIKGL